MLASLARQDDRPELKRDSPFRRFKYGVLNALVLSVPAFSLRGGRSVGGGGDRFAAYSAANE